MSRRSRLGITLAALALASAASFANAASRDEHAASRDEHAASRDEHAGARSLALPVPTGPDPIGTAVVHLTDRSRTDAMLPHGRPITVQVWYPARPGTGGARAPYLMEKGLA